MHSVGRFVRSSQVRAETSIRVILAGKVDCQCPRTRWVVSSYWRFASEAFAAGEACRSRALRRATTAAQLEDVSTAQVVVSNHTTHSKSSVGNIAVRHIPVNQELEIVPSTGSMDGIDSSRVLNVLDVLVQLGRRIIGQTGKRRLSPEARYQIWHVVDNVAPNNFRVVGVSTRIAVNTTPIGVRMRRGAHVGRCCVIRSCIG